MGLNYVEMLADAKAKRSALDALILSLEGTIAAFGQSGEVPASPSSATNTEPVELPVGAFNGKSLPAAVKLYLSAVKKKQTIREIATALRDGGVESTSDNFENVVTGALHRLKAAGEVLRFKDGWGLAEHYHESFRNRISQTQNPVKRRGRKSKPAAHPKTASAPLESRIEALLRLGQELSPKEIAEQLRISVSNAALSLGRMVKKGKAQKTDDGKYAPASASIHEMPKAV
jgi:DNA-binding NarL/FixJ family response regulator